MFWIYKLVRSNWVATKIYRFQPTIKLAHFNKQILYNSESEHIAQRGDNSKIKSTRTKKVFMLQIVIYYV